MLEARIVSPRGSAHISAEVTSYDMQGLRGHVRALTAAFCVSIDNERLVRAPVTPRREIALVEDNPQLARQPTRLRLRIHANDDQERYGACLSLSGQTEH